MSSLRKKKINTITENNNITSKSIDSFFTINTIPQISTSIQNEITELNNNSNNSNVESRNVVLSNLVMHKILYSHIEIKNRIENLSEDELSEIFKIIKINNEKYSTNKNGIFINLSTLKNTTIQEISNFLYFCDNTDKTINNEELERSKYKDMISDE